MRKVSFCIWVVCRFGIDAYIVMSFPLRTAFAASQRFWIVVSSFSLVSMNLLNSSSISWFTLSSLSRMVLNLQCVKSFQTSCCDLVLILRHYGLRICRGRSESFGIGSDAICDPVCGLFWRKFHVHLRRMFIQFSLDVKFCRYLWNLFAPVYHLKISFLWRCCA